MMATRASTSSGGCAALLGEACRGSEKIERAVGRAGKACRGATRGALTPRRPARCRRPSGLPRRRGRARSARAEYLSGRRRARQVRPRASRACLRSAHARTSPTMTRPIATLIIVPARLAAGGDELARERTLLQRLPSHPPSGARWSSIPMARSGSTGRRSQPGTLRTTIVLSTSPLTRWSTSNVSRAWRAPRSIRVSSAMTRPTTAASAASSRSSIGPRHARTRVRLARQREGGDREDDGRKATAHGDGLVRAVVLDLDQRARLPARPRSRSPRARARRPRAGARAPSSTRCGRRRLRLGGRERPRRR